MLLGAEAGAARTLRSAAAAVGGGRGGFVRDAAELDLEGGGAVRGRLGSTEKGERRPFSLFPGHGLTFATCIIVRQICVA